MVALEVLAAVGEATGFGVEEGVTCGSMEGWGDWEEATGFKSSLAT